MIRRRRRGRRRRGKEKGKRGECWKSHVRKEKAM